MSINSCAYAPDKNAMEIVKKVLIYNKNKSNETTRHQYPSGKFKDLRLK